jgi:hypothetical protein
MKGKEYYDYEHASQRLTGCIIGIDDTYGLVRSVEPISGDMSLKVVFLGDGKNTRINLSEHVLHSDNLQLGFVNHNTRRICKAYYMHRFPARTWKDGVDSRNSAILEASVEGDYTVGSDTANTLRISKGLLDTLTNEFPDYDHSFHNATHREGATGCAFSRRFAVDSNENLLFKRKGAVGIASKSGPVLKDGLMYLNEALQEDLG